jgi:hypothetical protein
VSATCTPLLTLTSGRFVPLFIHCAFTALFACVCRQAQSTTPVLTIPRQVPWGREGLYASSDVPSALLQDYFRITSGIRIKVALHGSLLCTLTAKQRDASPPHDVSGDGDVTMLCSVVQ